MSDDRVPREVWTARDGSHTTASLPWRVRLRLRRVTAWARDRPNSEVLLPRYFFVTGHIRAARNGPRPLMRAAVRSTTRCRVAMRKRIHCVGFTARFFRRRTLSSFQKRRYFKKWYAFYHLWALFSLQMYTQEFLDVPFSFGATKFRPSFVCLQPLFEQLRNATFYI